VRAVTTTGVYIHIVQNWNIKNSSYRTTKGSRQDGRQTGGESQIIAHVPQLLPRSLTLACM